MKSTLTKPFLIFLVALVLVASFLIFKPFLAEIFIAAVLVSIFYNLYEKLVKWLKGKKNLASLIMCLLVVLLIIIPIVNLIILAGQKSVTAYHDTVQFLNEKNLEQLQVDFLDRLTVAGVDSESVKNFVIETAKRSSNWLVDGAKLVIKGTTQFIFSVSLIVLAMFFFFVDGKKMLQRLMYLSPLPNKYDKEIFKKFRRVSYSAIVTTFVAAGAQGLVGGIGFWIAGIPAFLAGILMAFLSLLPYIGAAFIYVPVGVYLLFGEDIWKGLFILAWGAIVIGLTDNVIRGYMLKGKAELNPIFVIFSILGGIGLFGFWGIVLGPLIIAIAVTILHIYELEYGRMLEKTE